MLLLLDRRITLVLEEDVPCNSWCCIGSCAGLGRDRFDVFVEERQKTERKWKKEKWNFGFSASVVVIH